MSRIRITLLVEQVDGAGLKLANTKTYCDDVLMVSAETLLHDSTWQFFTDCTKDVVIRQMKEDKLL